MIHGVFGKLGSGKGLYVMDIIARELIDGFRDVVTNVPVKVLPWVNGQGIPQIGLKAYLLEKLFPLTEDEIDVILQRVKIIETEEECPDMYLNRRDGETGEWFKMAVTKTDAKGRPARFDMDEVKRRRCPGCLVVIDEAWAFYPNNGGWSRDPILNFYSRQQRKLRDECYIVTQHPTDCDEVFWKIAQDFHVCRNHGMERLGVFKQPDMFRVIVYSTNPAKGNAIKQYEIFRRLDKKLCQCYDTTGGVGMSGGFAGDANQKRKGIPIAWAGVGVLLIVVGLISVPHLLGKAASSWIGATTSGKIKPAAWAGNTNVATGVQLPPGGILPTPQKSDSLIRSESFRPETNVYCLGYSILNNNPVAFLSDGRVLHANKISRITPDSVFSNGREYEIKLATVNSAPVNVAPSSVLIGSPDEPVNKAVIEAPLTPMVPAPTPRLHGIESMRAGMNYR